MATINKDLGMVTAYAYAVSKGYTGTEEEFAQDIANMGQTAQAAAESAESAARSATTAGQSAESAAQSALEVSRAVEDVEAAATAAGESEAAASDSADDAQADALKAEGFAVGKQDGVDVDAQSEYYQNNSKYYKDQAKSIYDDAVEVRDSIPADYSTLSQDVTDLKADLNNLIIINSDGNLYANPMSGVRTVQSASKLQYYGTQANPNANYLTARIPVKANTEYTIIFSKATDYIQIVSASNEITKESFSSANPQSLVNNQLIVSKTDRSATVFHFTTDANASYVYLCSTIAGETNVDIYMGEGNISQRPTESTWVKNLDTYAKAELENLFETKKHIVVQAITNAVHVYFNVVGSYYIRITVGHTVDHSDSVYTDYWRINDSMLYTYDGENFTSAGKIPLVGAENEMALNFQGMGDHTGGWHGDERIDLGSDCYVKFIIDGEEYTVDELVSLGTIKCEKFSYREVSSLFASYSYNTNHFRIAKHVKETEIGNGGYKTRNYIGIDLSTFNADTLKILNAYTGLVCIGSSFANVAVSDIGTEYIGAHPTTTVILAEEMNKYSLTAKTYNAEYSCVIDSKIIKSNINEYQNPPINVDIWDRQRDLKYYSFLPEAVVSTGDYFATETCVEWNINN